LDLRGRKWQEDEDCIMRFINCMLHCITRVIKSRRMRWVGQVTHGRDEKCIQYFGWKT